MMHPHFIIGKQTYTLTGCGGTKPTQKKKIDHIIVWMYIHNTNLHTKTSFAHCYLNRMIDCGYWLS